MAQVTVGQAVLPIIPDGQHELFLTNLGPGELYYGRDPSVTSTSGTPLDPGNAVQGWPVAQPMYVVCGSGVTTIAYESNGSGVAIGATTATLAGDVTLAPGTTVGVSGGSVNANVVNQLQAQIVNTIQASIQGTVPVSGSVNSTVINQLQTAIVGQVQAAITNTSSNPLPVTGAVNSTVVNQLQTAIVGQVQAAIQGTVPISTASALPVSGTVGVSGTVPISAAAALPVSGSVGISGTPTVQGTVNVGNTVPVSGSVSSTVSGAVSVNNPAGTPVNVGGTVAVSSGSVNIANTPSVAIASGGVTINGTPNVNAAVSGNVGITGTPTVNAAVSGNVGIVGTSAVTISGTPSVSIASGTVNAAISGPVNIAAGNVNAVVSGSVTANNNVVVLAKDTSTSWSNVSSIALYDSGTTDLSAYTSLVFQLGGINMSGVDTTRSVQVQVQQYDSTGTFLIKQENPQFFTTGLMRYTTEIVAPRIKITLRAVGGQIYFTGYTIAASTAKMDHSYYQYPGSSSTFVNLTPSQWDANALSKYSGLMATISGGAQGTWFMDTTSGIASFSWSIDTTSTTSVAFRFLDAVTGDILMWSSPLNLTSAARADRGSLYLPESPVMMVLNNRESSGTTARTINAAVVYS